MVWANDPNEGGQYFLRIFAVFFILVILYFIIFLGYPFEEIVLNNAATEATLKQLLGAMQIVAAKAKSELLKARLKLGKVSYQQNEDLVPYTVLDQSISPGTVLDKSTTIDLIVSILDLQDIFDTLQSQK